MPPFWIPQCNGCLFTLNCKNILGSLFFQTWLALHSHNFVDEIFHLSSFPQLQPPGICQSNSMLSVTLSHETFHRNIPKKRPNCQGCSQIQGGKGYIDKKAKSGFSPKMVQKNSKKYLHLDCCWYNHESHISPI